ncbi:MAG: hypothetical protein K6F55_05095, partial [Eubacterium sp.]|nr:hypothetical protein [Eubacterium sp.]
MFNHSISRKLISFIISFCIIFSSFITSPAVSVQAAGRDIDVTPVPSSGTANYGNIYLPDCGYSTLDELKAAGYTKFELKIVASFEWYGSCCPFMAGIYEYHVIRPNTEETITLDFSDKSNNSIENYG